VSTAYVIEEKEGKAVLYSIVTQSDTWYGKNHKFKNFVCEGTLEYCSKIKERLQPKGFKGE
jgi:hypothetical protein